MVTDMNNVFDYLLKLTDPTELGFSMVILAPSAVYLNTKDVYHGQIYSWTGLSASGTDKQRTNPPVRSRTAWFRTVLKEKLGRRSPVNRVRGC